MVSQRKTATHKPARTKSSDPSPSTLLEPVQKEASIDSLGQHHCGSPHKQTRGNTLGGALHSHVETPHMVQQTSNNTQSKTRPSMSLWMASLSETRSNTQNGLFPFRSSNKLEHYKLHNCGNVHE